MRVDPHIGRLAFAYGDDAVGDGRKGLVVRDEHDRLSRVVAGRLQQPQNLLNQVRNAF